MTVAITKDPNSSLKYFQEWQETINPGDDSHPNHHDCAILITKYLAIELTLRVSNLISNQLQRSFVSPGVTSVICRTCAVSPVPRRSLELVTL